MRRVTKDRHRGVPLTPQTCLSLQRRGVLAQQEADSFRRRSAVSDANQPLNQKLAHAMRKYLVMSFYHFVVFSLLVVYKSLILAEHHIAFARHGFALINALALAKVMLRVLCRTICNPCSGSSVRSHFPWPCHATPITAHVRDPSGIRRLQAFVEQNGARYQGGKREIDRRSDFDLL